MSNLRAFASLSLRAKFLIMLTAIVVSIAVLGGLALYVVYTHLTTRVRNEQALDVQSKVVNINAFLSSAQSDAIFLSRSSALNHYLAVMEVGIDPATIADARAALEAEFLAFAQARLFYDQVRFLDAAGQEIARVNTTSEGVSTIVAQADLQDKSDRYYFQNSIGLAPGQVYVSPLDLDGKIQVPHKPVMRYATPVYLNDQPRGVIVTHVLAENFLAPLDGAQTPAFLVDADGYYLYHPHESKRWGRDLGTGITVAQDFPGLTAALASAEPGTAITAGRVFAFAPVTLPGEHTPRWYVVNYLSRGRAFAPVIQAFYVGLISIAITLLAAVAVMVFFSRTVTAPLIGLTRTAEKVALGDLNAQACVEFGDEIGTLATVFNSMTAQLRQTLTGLEQRVAERTRALETSAEISRRLSALLDQEQLVTAVVEQVQAAFDYYHVHIYLVDEEGGDLVMAGGSGEAGRMLLASGHRVPRGQGLMGRAAATNTVVLAPDVSQDEGWLSHVLLPHIRSEVVVPIAVGERVLGVLDVQQDEVGGLDQDDVDLLSSIAVQVAIALQNIGLIAETRRRAEHQVLINLITQRVQSTTTVESALQVAVRELGRALDASETAVRLHGTTEENRTAKDVI
jgi:putative methionine-R-sulfoxide reductase with GAF domain